MKERFYNFNYGLLIVSVLLIVLGILILASASREISQKTFGSPSYILFHQIKFGILPGILLGGACFFLPLATIKRWALISLLIVLVLMGLVFFPKIGISSGGASRWIGLGSISLQPSEFLKLAFIIYLAAWISGRESKSLPFKSRGKKFSLSRLKGSKSKIFHRKFAHSMESAGLGQLLIPFLIIISLISLFLIFQPDISTLGIIVLVAVLMYFVAKTQIYHSILLISAGFVGLVVLINLAPYRFNRLLTFLKADMDPMGIGYQINQALIAIGSGGLWGKGLGMGIQQFGFLPQPISDSIFAVFAEETGFIGSSFLILLFIIFAILGFKISVKSSDKFSQILALGITLWIVIQGFVNISSIVGILPLTGIPLPFVAYGGSHLIAELTGVGILLNISKTT